MSCVDQNETVGGAELTLAAMDEFERWEIGQKTYWFVKRMLRDPEMRKLHAQKKTELEASGYFDRFREPAPQENTVRGGITVSDNPPVSYADSPLYTSGPYPVVALGVPVEAECL